MEHLDFKVVCDTSLKKKMKVITFLTIVILFGATIPLIKYDILEQYPASGFLVFIITVGFSASYYCWKIFRYRCPKCGSKILASRDYDRSTITYDCVDCHIIWDSTIVKSNASSDSSNDTF